MLSYCEAHGLHKFPRCRKSKALSTSVANVHIPPGIAFNEWTGKHVDVSHILGEHRIRLEITAFAISIECAGSLTLQLSLPNVCGLALQSVRLFGMLVGRVFRSLSIGGKLFSARDLDTVVCTINA